MAKEGGQASCVELSARTLIDVIAGFGRMRNGLPRELRGGGDTAAVHLLKLVHMLFPASFKPRLSLLSRWQRPNRAVKRTA